MSHWTYETFQPSDDLQQGDIITRTPPLLAVLEQAHKHFANEKYLAFIVLTQSCDMVRRSSSPCKSRYINLAVVRPLEDMLFRLLDSTCFKVADGVYTTNTQYRAKQLLSRIINQNEQGQGLFYLHPDAEAGIAVPSVALLQVNIALRREHYETLLDARIGRLTNEFQTRLGWLIGNLYSRVATREWETAKSGEIIDSALNRTDNTAGPYWVSRECMREAKKQKISTKGKPASEIAHILTRLRPTRPMDIAIERTILVIRQAIRDTSDQDMEKIRNLLSNDLAYEKSFSSPDAPHDPDNRYLQDS